MRSLCALLLRIPLFVLSAMATNIILPLYVYPEDNAITWSSVSKTVAAYPNVQWQIIINPHSGPGTSSANPYPNSDYVSGIKDLNKWSNVKTLGYVDTAFGKRAISDVRSDIDQYAIWANYSAEDISMDGIFFDDVPSIYDFQNSPGTQSPNETYFKSITSYAYTTLARAGTSVILNSGNPGASSFFEYCDTMIEFENQFQTYKGQATLKSITADGGSLNHSAVVMYSVATTLTASIIYETIRTMKNNNVQLIGLTNDCCYNMLNETLLRTLAAACNATGTSTSTADALSEASSILQAPWGLIDAFKLGLCIAALAATTLL